MWYFYYNSKDYTNSTQNVQFMDLKQIQIQLHMTKIYIKNNEYVNIEMHAQLKLKITWRILGHPLN